MYRLPTAVSRFTGWADISFSGLTDSRDAGGISEAIAGTLIGFASQTVKSAQGRGVRLRLTIEDENQPVWETDALLCEVTVPDEMVGYAIIEKWRPWLATQNPTLDERERIRVEALAIAAEVAADG